MDIPPSLNVFLHVFAGVFGVCVGSFLNVCIYRLPKEDMSIWKPKRSLCFSCRETIGWYDNIPVISYLILRGRCRHCGEKFSPRYAMVEFLTGVFFVLIYHRFGLSLAMPIYLALGAALIAASFIDIDHFIIPDEITLPGIGIGLAVGVLVPLIFWKQETGFIPASVASLTPVLTLSRVIPLLMVFRIASSADSMPKRIQAQPASFISFARSSVMVSTRE